MQSLEPSPRSIADSESSMGMLGRVAKPNPDSDAGKQDEGGEALDQLVVAGGEAA